MIFSLLLFLLLGISMVLQEFIPTIEQVHHGRLLLVPVVFLASSITVPYPVMLLLALMAGFMWDARHVVIVEGIPADAEVQAGGMMSGMEVDLPFGCTIFLYGLLGSLMQGVRPLFRRGRWELPSVMIGFATLLLLLFEYLFINFRRGDFYFPVEVWHKILSSALLSMLIAPLVFLLLYRLAASSGTAFDTRAFRDAENMVVRYRFRLYLLALITVAGFAGLLFRLWSIQIDQHEEFRSRVPGTSELTVRVPGVRGEILDRNGVPLVTNRPSYEVIFNLKEIYSEYRKQHSNIPKYSYLGRVGGMPKEVTEVDIVEIVNTSVIERLQELGLAKPFSSTQLRVHYRSTKGVVPYTYRRDLTFEEFARFAEHNLDLPGVSVAARPSRHYVFDSLASHLLGYVKLPDPKQVSEEVRNQFDFYVGDDFGIHGLEKSMDQYLQGRPGKRILLRNEKGRIVGETAFEPPEKGFDIYLTIDAKVQYITEEAMRAVGRGAAVVIDPRNGDILAMASVPSFNPNKFIPQIQGKHWEEYLGNPTNPLTNRAIQSFAPGSTYKVPVAIAGMLSGAHRRYFSCPGRVAFGNRFMKCWIYEKGGAHGSLALNEAIKRSCNAFFYLYGNETGINNIQTAGKLLGLGEKTGIPVGSESPGILPSPRWLMLNQPGMRWTSALTALVSIGQGATEASPLQMANVVATVANGGLCYKPRLVSRAENKNGEIITITETALRTDLTKEGIARSDLEIVRQGMWAVVNESGGTAGRARSKKTTIAGKTGTAQAFRPDGKKDNNAWFIGFAPYDAPELAVCVMVQNGKSGGGVGAPIARKIIEETLAIEHGYEIPLQVVAEAAGNFDFFEYVTFDANEKMEETFEDADTGAQVELAGLMPVPRQAAPAAVPVVQAPSIEPEADAEGSRVAKALNIFRPKSWKRQPDSSDSGDSSESTRKKRGLFRR